MLASRHTVRWTDKQANRDRLADGWTDDRSDGRTDRQADRQTGRQTENKQTDLEASRQIGGLFITIINSIL